MQSRQGYCSCCCVHYNNLEQHIFSAQHRNLATQRRHQMRTSSLMERFLEDVLRHHPYQYQESRSHNERLMNTMLPSEVAPCDDFIPEEMAEDTAGSIEEIPTKGFEPTEELCSRPRKSQEYMKNISIRPSVIKKLEKRQQQPLENGHKIGNGMKELNIVVGQAANNGQNLISPSLISNAPTNCLSESCYDRPDMINTTKLSPAVHLNSVGKCDPNKINRYLDQIDKGSSNTVSSAHLETSSVSCIKAKESYRKSLGSNSGKLVLKKDVKSQDKIVSTGFKSHEIIHTEGPFRFESLSKLAVNPEVVRNKTDRSSNKGIFEDTIPKYHEKFFSTTDCTQEEKHLVFNNSNFLEQNCSVSSEMKFDCSSLHLVSDQPQDIVQDLNLWREERIDQEDKNYESGESEMSFDCSSSFQSLTDQSKVTAKEINFSKEVYDDLQYKNNKSCEISFVCESSLQVVTNQSQVTAKDLSLQKVMHISLVDQSYESSSSEINFDYDPPLQSIIDHSQQPVKEVKLPKEVHNGLVDRNFESSNSETSVDSAFSVQTMVDRLPVAVGEIKPWKKFHIGLVDKSYGSSCSETSVDCDVSVQSVVDHPQLPVKKRNLKDRHDDLKDKNHKPSGANAHLDCDISLQKVTDEPQRTAKETNLLKENADLLNKNHESHGPEMDFHTVAQLAADQSQVVAKEVYLQELDTDLENKSEESSISGQSFDFHPSLHQSASDQPQGALGEINPKEFNVDMEINSCECSSSELTFDSDLPLLSVAEKSQLAIEEIKEEHSNLGQESCESNSSDITFDSDISLPSVVDQPQVIFYKEEHVDLENKSNQSSVSEITFDSDSPFHSETDQSEVAVKEMTIQKEEHVHLGNKNDEPGGSEISLNSDILFHSVTHPPEIVVKKLNLQKEEQENLENKGSELSGSEFSMDYITFHSMTDYSTVPIKEIQPQKRQAHSENKGNGPSVSEISLKSNIPLHLVTEHFDKSVKNTQLQKEEQIHLKNKGNKFGISETGLHSDIPLQSVTHQLGIIVKELHLQRKEHAELEGKSAKLCGTEINLDSDVPHSVTESQITDKEINIQNGEHILEDNSDACSSSKTVLDLDDRFQSMTAKTQVALLKKDVFYPEDEVTKAMGFEISLDIALPLHSVTDQPQLDLLKEKHIDLEDQNSQSSDSEICFESDNPLQSLAEQFQEAVTKIDLWKEKDIGLENRINEPNGSELICDSDFSLQSAADEPEVTVKEINLEKEDHLYQEDKDSQFSGSEMSLDSDFLVQSIVDQPQITILEQEHLELEEDKQNQSCSSETSFDSDDPLQSVTDQLKETVKKKSLWKDEEVDLEDKRDDSRCCEIMYNYDVLPSVADQTEEVVTEISLWKEHVNLEDKIVKPSSSKLNFDSNEPVQSVVDEIPESIQEINFLREENVCLNDKGYEHNDSKIIHVSDVLFQSEVEQPHILKGEHSNLEDKSSESGDPKISFNSDDRLQSVTGQLQRAVNEISLWKEEHIYLENKSFKQDDFEVIYDSDIPVQFEADHLPVAVKKINFLKKDHNDLESKCCKPSGSDINCDSGIHLPSEVDQPQVASKEANLQKEEHLDMEEKISEPSDPEMIYDSDIPLQIVNPSQVPVKETNLPKVILVHLVTSDSDYEIISDSYIHFQSVTDKPQMTVKEISCINAEYINLEDESCDSHGSEVRYVCEATPRSVTNQSKDIFKVVNQKEDYIVLEDSSCNIYGSEINFNVDSSQQSMAYQTQSPDKKMEKYIDPEDKNYESSGPKRNFTWKDSSQAVTDQLQKANKEVNLQKDLKDSNLKNKHCESSSSAVDCYASHESVIHQMPDKENLSKLKHTDPQSMNCEPCYSEMNFQCDTSLQSEPQEAVCEMDLFKKSFDLKDKNPDSHSSSFPIVNLVRNLEKSTGVIERDPDEPVLEYLPHIPSSCVRKTWSQIMRKDDIKMNALVKESKPDHFHCYFPDDCGNRQTEKKFLNEGKKITWTDLNQDTASVQVVSDCDITHGVSDIDDLSMTLDKPCHHSPAKRPYKQNWCMASRCQTIKLNHGTQTNFMSYPVMKRRMIRKDEDSPKRKCLLLQNDQITKKKIKIGMVEFPESCVKVLKPLQPSALVYVLSSPSIKQKEGEFLSVCKMRCHSDTDSWNNIQYRYKWDTFKYPLANEIVINSHLNTIVPESDSPNWVKIHFIRSNLNSSAQGNDTHIQSSASAPLMTVRYGLRSHQGASGSVFLEKSEVLNSSEIPKESSFQLTLLSHDVSKICPKSVRNESLESKSKEKMEGRMMTISNKPCFPKKVYRPIILQQKSLVASEKQSVWIRTKPSDVIRKYISKYSVFLRHRYQSRSAFIGIHLKKKKTDVSRLKKVKRPAKMLLNSVPSVGTSVSSTGTEEQLERASSAPKQPVQDSSSIAGRQTNASLTVAVWCNADFHSCRTLALSLRCPADTQCSRELTGYAQRVQHLRI
ncbi:DBF4-type zinc finger-containing protein 2 isoform X2 [Tamandua tetradactyla]|uniref:DBF4-type zinc finger-containing protein 2 isoform X2 n=1 Tax=Tamandua tetradactyla TaxID=48850 RepID=UPI004054064C